MPKITFKPMCMSKKEHKEYIEQIKEIMNELDYTLRCYYVSLSDDHNLTDDEKLSFMRYAFEEALKSVEVSKEMTVRFHGTAS